MYDTSQGADPGTTFNAIVEIGSGPLDVTSEVDAVFETATIDLPLSIAVNPHCWFLVRGERWNYLGLGGRDRDLQTINVQSARPIGTRTAKRR